MVGRSEGHQREGTVGGGRGRTKRRWLDAVRDDIREKGLSGEEEKGRSKGRHQRERKD